MWIPGLVLRGTSGPDQSCPSGRSLRETGLDLLVIPSISGRSKVGRIASPTTAITSPAGLLADKNPRFSGENRWDVSLFSSMGAPVGEARGTTLDGTFWGMWGNQGRNEDSQRLQAVLAGT